MNKFQSYKLDWVNLSHNQCQFTLLGSAWQDELALIKHHVLARILDRKHLGSSFVASYNVNKIKSEHPTDHTTQTRYFSIRCLHYPWWSCYMNADQPSSTYGNETVHYDLIGYVFLFSLCRNWSAIEPYASICYLLISWYQIIHISLDMFFVTWEKMLINRPDWCLPCNCAGNQEP